MSRLLYELVVTPIGQIAEPKPWRAEILTLRALDDLYLDITHALHPVPHINQGYGALRDIMSIG
jgi:2-keto-3-deoxy-L-rhamnonate aldolase RhmA